MTRWLVPLCLLAACTPSATTPDGGASDAASVPDSGALVDGGARDAGVAADSGVTTTRSAVVLMTQGPGGGRSTAGANFFDDASAIYLDEGVIAFACTPTTTGPCTYYDCSTMLVGSALGAGTLTWTRAAGGMITMDAVVNPAAAYPYGFMNYSVGWAEGEPVQVTATGSTDVPGFSGSVALPSTTTLTGPADGATVPRASDLTVTWMPFAHGEAHVRLYEPSAYDHPVVCHFPGMVGSGTVPASALASLPLGPVSVSMTTADEQRVVAGTWAVRIVAAVNAVNGSRSLTLE